MNQSRNPPLHAHTTRTGVRAYDAARWMVEPPPVRNVHRLANGVHCLVQVGASVFGDAVQEALVSDRHDESLLVFPDGSSAFDLHLGQRRVQPGAAFAMAQMGPRTEARWVGHPGSGRMVQLHFPPGLREMLTHRHRAPAFEGQFVPAGGSLRAVLDAFCADTDAADTSLPVLDAYVSLLAQKLSGASQVVRGGLAHWQVRRACEAIEASTDETFELMRFASMVNLSASHFSRAFKRSLGCSPSRWHRRTRMSRAMDLLRDPRLSLTEVAQLCGFSAQAQFTTSFRQVTGVTPGTWRRRHLD